MTTLQTIAQAITQGGAVGVVGSPGTLITAVESGYGAYRSTRLTFGATASLPSVTSTLAVGKLVYTFPAGEIFVDSASMSLALLGTANALNVPEVALGTTIGTGASATLATTTENLILGATVAGCAGQTYIKALIPTANVPFGILAAAVHTVYFNAACIWTGTEAATLISGFIVINWRFMS